MKNVMLMILFFLSTICCGSTENLNSWNAGELSPYLEGRADIEKYFSGCRYLENYLPYTYGAIQKRPGTKYVPTSPGTITVTGDYTPCYPTLQALTAAEIPTKPTEVADTALSGATTFTQADAATMCATIAGGLTGHYALGGDIDLTGVTWTPIAGFSGVFDGGGYTISNLTISAASTSYVGMFSYLGNGAEFRNLNFSGCSVTGKRNISILCAGDSATHKVDNVSFKDITFTNCTITSGNNNTYYTYAGCLMGNVYGGDINIWRCSTSNCNITLDYATNPTYTRGGMLVGFVSGSTYAGTINVIDCYSNGGTIKSSSAGGGLLGALVGQSTYWANIYGCYSSSNITEDRATIAYGIDTSGGLIGSSSYSNITNCYATGNITADANHQIRRTGGFIGIVSSDANIINCYSTGNISASLLTSTGGFVGEINANVTITGCYNTGTITGIGTTIGGQLSVGGFVGLLDVRDTDLSVVIEKSYSTGDVTIAAIGQMDAVGGFIGRFYVRAWEEPTLTNDFIIKNCYTWSSVDVEPSIGTGSGTGGFIGRYDCDYQIDNAKIQNCYDAQTNSKYGSGLTDQINGETNVDGFLGEQKDAGSLTTENSFFDCDTSGIGAYAGSHIFKWEYSKDSGGLEGDDTCWIDNIAFPATGSPLEGFETGDFSAYTWTKTGDADWTVTSAEQYAGTYSAKAGAISDSQISTLTATIVCLNGDISFYYKVSSEADYDFLKVYDTNSFLLSKSGSTGWTKFDVATAKIGKARSTTWLMDKSNFQDAGWDFDTIWVICEGTIETTDVDGKFTDGVRLIPFEFSTDDAYILAFGNGFIGFYRNQ